VTQFEKIEPQPTFKLRYHPKSGEMEKEHDGTLGHDSLNGDLCPSFKK